MKKCKNKTSFVNPQMPKARVIHAIHDFSVWLRTGSDLADINWFRCHTGSFYSCPLYFYQYIPIIITM